MSNRRNITTIQGNMTEAAKKMFRKAMHTEWEQVFVSGLFNLETEIRRDPRGRLHMICTETTLDGKRFDPDANVSAEFNERGIEWQGPRWGKIITDTIITPQEAVKFILDASVPAEFKKFVRIQF